MGQRITGALDALQLVAVKLRNAEASSTYPGERILAIIKIDGQHEAGEVIYTKADIRRVDGMAVALHYAEEAVKDGKTVGVILAMNTPFPWPNPEMITCVSEYQKAIKALGLSLIDVLAINRTHFYSYADEVTREVA